MTLSHFLWLGTPCRLVRPRYPLHLVHAARSISKCHIVRCIRVTDMLQIVQRLMAIVEICQKVFRRSIGGEKTDMSMAAVSALGSPSYNGQGQPRGPAREHARSRRGERTRRAATPHIAEVSDCRACRNNSSCRSVESVDVEGEKSWARKPADAIDKEKLAGHY